MGSPSQSCVQLAGKAESSIDQLSSKLRQQMRMEVHLAALLLLLRVSNASPQAPPPPPGSGSVSSSPTSVPAPPSSGPPTTPATLGARYYGASAAPTTTWVYDSNCPADTPPFGLGKWIEVTEDEC